ncbi:MAG: hypothetical protein NTV80_24235 [Verrucomicrobia bacterium]|nr:hypothetical protein [Verrucomicrobiota bacterium]
MTLPRCYIPVVWLLLAQAGAAQMPAPVLQAILSLEKMTPLHASVRVSGVVTAVEAGRFFLQDRTAAMSILRTPTTPNIKAGDVCEAVGSIQSKNAGLEMQPVTITITGQAALPAAKTASVAQLQSGGAKYQRVKFTGHVHEVGVTADSIIIALESSGSTCVATWPSEAADAASAKPPLDLLDALVEIDGVAPPQLSNAVRPGGLRIVLAQASHLKVKQLGHADPFQRPHRDLAKMRGKDTEAGVRYLVRGTVSYWSDAGWFYFQDGTSSARGNSGTFLPLIIGWPYRMEARNPPLKAGDQIELVGYREPAVGAMPSFLHCTWRVVGHTDPPPFEPTTLKKILATDREGYPVSVTGKVTDIQFQRDAQGFINHNLWMDAEGLSCRVLVQKKSA